MLISVLATKTYIDGDCSICRKAEVCLILYAVREFPLCDKLTFDCPYADLKDEG